MDAQMDESGMCHVCDPKLPGAVLKEGIAKSGPAGFHQRRQNGTQGLRRIDPAKAPGPTGKAAG